MKKSKWYKLDNTAKVVPSMTSDVNPNVFRLSCNLCEDIDEKILSKALSNTLDEFPMFNCTLNSGLFWHYLEKIEKKVKVYKDDQTPCKSIKNGYLYKVSFYKTRINLEVYHVLSDGNGAMEFLKYLVCDYINLKHKLDKNVVTNETTPYEKEKDDFQTFDKSGKRFKMDKVKKAYKLNLSKKDSNDLDVIEVHSSVKKLKEVAKKYNVTVTTYLTALYIKSIISTLKIKELNKPIGITLPVDLRNIFPSKTSRNFFYTVLISYKPNSINEFEDIIKEVDRQIKEKTSVDNIQKVYNSFMIAEKYFFIRIVPNFIKDIVLKRIAKSSKRGQTTVLSNLGVIKVPEIYQEYIESFIAMSSTEDIQLSICSFNGKLVSTFTSHLVPKDIERKFILDIKKYTNDEVEIVCNIRGERDE